MQDPELYLEARSIHLQSFFDESKPARLDVEHRARVNYELYFFATAPERERFLKDPLAYCGKVTDPVTYARFEPDADSPRIDYHGQPFFFESDSSHDMFASMPDSFLVPKFNMRKMQAADEDMDEHDD